jgi:hypothetical protein
VRGLKTGSSSDAEDTKRFRAEGKESVRGVPVLVQSLAPCACFSREKLEIAKKDDGIEIGLSPDRRKAGDDFTAVRFDVTLHGLMMMAKPPGSCGHRILIRRVIEWHHKKGGDRPETDRLPRPETWRETFRRESVTGGSILVASAAPNSIRNECGNRKDYTLFARSTDCDLRTSLKRPQEGFLYPTEVIRVCAKKKVA